jgi:hypothetical protein
MAGLLAVGLSAPVRAAEVPTPDMLRVLDPQAEGPRITPYLAHQVAGVPSRRGRSLRPLRHPSLFGGSS